MRSILIDIMSYEIGKLRLWRLVAIISIALHLLRSFWMADYEVLKRVAASKDFDLDQLINM